MKLPKRYEIEAVPEQWTYGVELSIEESTEGEWVRWEDVKRMIRDEHYE